METAVPVPVPRSYHIPYVPHCVYLSTLTSCTYYHHLLSRSTVYHLLWQHGATCCQTTIYKFTISATVGVARSYVPCPQCQSSFSHRTFMSVNNITESTLITLRKISCSWFFSSSSYHHFFSFSRYFSSPLLQPVCVHLLALV